MLMSTFSFARNQFQSRLAFSLMPDSQGFYTSFSFAACMRYLHNRKELGKMESNLRESQQATRTHASLFSRMAYSVLMESNARIWVVTQHKRRSHR